MLSFLLDIAELPEVRQMNTMKYILLTFLQSHSGVAMANAFQSMLQQFGLSEKILAVNADNASSNDTQTIKLDQLDNTFNKENRVRCFNHTLQLSAKALLRPFNIGLSAGKATDDSDEIDQDDEDNIAVFEDDEDEGDDGDDGQGEEDDPNDNIDELGILDEDERNQVLEDTTVVRDTITKVSITVRTSITTILTCLGSETCI